MEGTVGALITALITAIGAATACLIKWLESLKKADKSEIHVKMCFAVTDYIVQAEALMPPRSGSEKAAYVLQRLQETFPGNDFSKQELQAIIDRAIRMHNELSKI